MFALQGGNPGIAATLITRVSVAARRDHTEIPAMLDILKLDHRVRAQLPQADA